jgi:HK97 gp10 family phage protein
MSRADVHLEGFKDLEKNMKGLRGFVNSKQVVDGLHDGVKVMGRIAKNKAPRGPTGNLKRAIRTGIFGKQKRGSPAVFMAIRRGKGEGRHAHLVEYGTKRRIPRQYSVLKFEIDGQIIYVRRVGPMPAKPFWRPAVDIGKNAAGRVASKKIAREIEREVARKKMHRYATLI